MARTMKYLERKAMEAYAELSENPNYLDCPLGYWDPDSSGWQMDLKVRLGATEEICHVCAHFFNEIKSYDKRNPCPCCLLGKEKSFAMLRRYVKKWRKAGLI